jgi:hypothetical protein
VFSFPLFLPLFAPERKLHIFFLGLFQSTISDSMFAEGSLSFIGTAMERESTHVWLGALGSVGI